MNEALTVVEPVDIDHEAANAEDDTNRFYSGLDVHITLRATTRELYGAVDVDEYFGGVALYFIFFMLMACCLPSM